MRQVLIALALALSVFVAGSAWAQQTTDPHAARVANDVSHVILSPFCPGKTLAMCPSPAAAEVRMKIQEMAESGMNPDEIKEAVIAEHGEEFRVVEPPWTDDIGLLGALGGGLALAVFAVVIISRRRGSNADEKETSASEEVSDEDPYLDELRKQYRD